MAVVSSPVYAKVYKFLVSAPTPKQIIDFHASDMTQARVRELLDSNRENCLTSDERSELDEFECVNHFVSMLKIYARPQVFYNPFGRYFHKPVNFPGKSSY